MVSWQINIGFILPRSGMYLATTAKVPYPVLQADPAPVIFDQPEGTEQETTKALETDDVSSAGGYVQPEEFTLSELVLLGRGSPCVVQALARMHYLLSITVRKPVQSASSSGLKQTLVNSLP